LQIIRIKFQPDFWDIPVSLALTVLILGAALTIVASYEFHTALKIAVMAVAILTTMFIVNHILDISLHFTLNRSNRRR